MWLSRVVINQEGGLKSLGPLLLPDDDSERFSVGHRMIWSLFPKCDDRADGRMHLWREETSGRYIVLSRQKPTGHALLEVLEFKAFEPHVVPGDRLRFRLRVNPTVTTKRAGATGSRMRRGKRTDVIMDAICALEPGTRAQARNRQLGWGEDESGRPQPLQAPREWLDRQGSTHGFNVIEAVALSYETLRIPRRNSGLSGSRSAARIGVVDLDGVLEVSDPARFVARLTSGFGAAKAFGCGLMLIRRA